MLAEANRTTRPRLKVARRSRRQLGLPMLRLLAIAIKEDAARAEARSWRREPALLSSTAARRR